MFSLQSFLYTFIFGRLASVPKVSLQSTVLPCFDDLLRELLVNSRPTKTIMPPNRTGLVIPAPLSFHKDQAQFEGVQPSEDYDRKRGNTKVTSPPPPPCDDLDQGNASWRPSLCGFYYGPRKGTWRL